MQAHLYSGMLYFEVEHDNARTSGALPHTDPFPALGLVVVGAGRGGDVPLVALVLCLLAALSWACGNVIARAAGVPITTELGGTTMLLAT